MSENTTDSSECVLNTLTFPKHSGWKCHVLGRAARIVWEPNEGEVPNRWVRFWMRVFFGSVWERIDEQEGA
jgi:hypothetical protein